MNVKMEEQSAMNNYQLQVDRRLLNICRPENGVRLAAVWRGDISLLGHRGLFYLFYHMLNL